MCVVVLSTHKHCDSGGECWCVQSQHLPAIPEGFPKSGAVAICHTLGKLGHASLVFDQKIQRGGQTLFETLITIACVDRAS